MTQIPKDAAYNAVDPTDSRPCEHRSAMARVPPRRQDHLGDARHFWDPLDNDHRLERRRHDKADDSSGRILAVFHTRSAMRCARAEDQVANESTRWQISAILHGEQGALRCPLALPHLKTRAPRNSRQQTREEARHVTGFTNYVKARWARRCRARNAATL